MKKTIAIAAIALMLAATGFAQKKPAHNVSARRHPNIAAAQKLVSQAYYKIVAAQTANEFDLEGHGKKAKELLEQANDELKKAAQAANER